MSRIKKILIILILTITVVFTCNCHVLADPSSSKGFAEYDDLEAEQENEKKMEEQNNKFDIEKSSNNYLDDLQVEGYKLSPEFDKQTLEYTIDKEITSDNINIKATASDSKAKIEGIGNIKLQNDQNQCRIDVIAESGTTRTYIIKIKETKTTENENTKQENENNQYTAENNENIQDTVEENENAIVELYSQKNENVNKKDNKYIFVIIGIISLVIAIFFICKLNKTKNGRHKK